jgi:hypothetical protein
VALIVRSVVCCCRLGTTLKAAGSQENFMKIDKECVKTTLSYCHCGSPLTSFGFVLFVISYVVNAAKAAKVDKDQRLIHVSVRHPHLVTRPILHRWSTWHHPHFLPFAIGYRGQS